MNILITGASKGIGKAIAIEMAKNGHNLALCARNIHDLELLKAELNLTQKQQIFIGTCNCDIKTDVQSFNQLANNTLGKIDVLINNVGVFKYSFILDEEDDVMLSQMQTNLLSAYFFYKEIGKSMRKNQAGHIFNICSVASIETLAHAGSYCVTKAAMLSLNNVMREELKKYGVKVTAILPGATYTHSWEGFTNVPQNFVQPQDIARAITHTLQMTAHAYTEQIIVKSLLVKS
ncbi:MAG: SDR family oxidoreductase [Sphingobacteriales bacterium]|nr:MAG: SDR family oxidoreductase [Sphingobacteriales bacterium]TAF80810.1 MAG: SDR family oxidoreductase [Sphingobacteriales bacterium]